MMLREAWKHTYSDTSYSAVCTHFGCVIRSSHLPSWMGGRGSGCGFSCEGAGGATKHFLENRLNLNE